jgi:glycerol-3-phosphate dehydrogenase
VLDNARAVSGLPDEELLAPIGEHVPATLAELIFGVTHEGAADVDDLLDRRTRVGLVAADRDLAAPTAARALQIALPAIR